MLLQTIQLDALIFWVVEENAQVFSWHCRSLEDNSTFDSGPYRNSSRLLQDIHLYALNRRISQQKFPGIVADFMTNHIICHNKVAGRIFSLPARLNKEQADSSRYWKQKQLVEDHKRQMLERGSNIITLDLVTPSGFTLGVSTEDELYELPNKRKVIVTNVFELDESLLIENKPSRLF